MVQKHMHTERKASTSSKYGKVTPQKLFYKGNDIDFILFVDSADEFNRYISGDTTVPLSEVLSSYDVFKNIQGSGSSGTLEIASKQELHSEFGNYKSLEDDVIPVILKEGQLQGGADILSRYD